MENEKQPEENQDKNQENEGQQIKRLRKERDTYKAQKAHWKKKAEAKVEEKPKAKAKEEKSNEPDYAKLAFLKGEKVDNSDDIKLVLDEAERLKLPLTDILNMKHIKSQLKDNKDQREAEGGSPKGKGKSGGSASSEVDYWIDKKNPDGTYKTPEDQELAGKVINARIKKEESKNMFSEELFTG